MDHQVSLPPSTTTGLSFKVHRRQPELVTPAKPTPRELKLLSDLDDQQGLRFQFPVIFFYRPNLTTNHDPVQVIRRALSETLVYYYPFAGRLRELSNRKLAVDCTGEGVLFIEAEADVTLAELEEANELLPPFPCLEELLFDVEGSSEVLNTPLLLVQVSPRVLACVSRPYALCYLKRIWFLHAFSLLRGIHVQITRLTCGGFIFALRFNHTMTDGSGLSLFLKSLCELACGLHAPSVLPVWDRHLLTVNVLEARVIHRHREYEDQVKIDTVATGDHLVTRSFFFSTKDISAIRKFLPSDLHNTSFEALTSFLWRCRTVALSPDPNTEMRLTCIINSRSKLSNPPLSPGYYGNVFVIPAAIATAKDLMEKPLEFALRLIQEIKASVTEDYVRSVIALMATRGRPMFVTAENYIISDLRHFGLGKVDFGPWGKPVYGGTAKAGIAVFPGVSFYVPFKNKKGETGTVVAISLPVRAMERFVVELDDVLNVFNG
ncbi:(Z)-3-hexen-1-ol acetyltransferase [Cardamine amara subsp. amara]|uniref:(Z)-3-hexen-1-ol acetyltransferase n=1 Tax=Cardamine amara subsp. amara TaxID=228776 RepID=A0ABD1AXN0_CARAN